jgi:serine/threonine protein kinase
LICRSGYYREAWLVNDASTNGVERNKTDFILKQMMLPSDEDDEDHLPNSQSLAKIHKDALIMERLTSSPRIVNIYGHCATTILTEASEDGVADSIVPQSGHYNQNSSDHMHSIHSFNAFTPLEKLDIAIEMSKSIADLHGFSDGIIVHGDIHPVQWLRSRVHGGLQLNDFNNAEILNIHQPASEAENITYCKTNRGTWYGAFRSPEELSGDIIDEQIDVYSMGNNIYSLLTGLVRNLQGTIKFACHCEPHTMNEYFFHAVAIP